MSHDSTSQQADDRRSSYQICHDWELKHEYRRGYFSAIKEILDKEVPISVDIRNLHTGKYEKKVLLMVDSALIRRLFHLMHQDKPPVD